MILTHSLRAPNCTIRGAAAAMPSTAEPQLLNSEFHWKFFCIGCVNTSTWAAVAAGRCFMQPHGEKYALQNVPTRCRRVVKSKDKSRVDNFKISHTKWSKRKAAGKNWTFVSVRRQDADFPQSKAAAVPLSSRYDEAYEEAPPPSHHNHVVALAFILSPQFTFAQDPRFF